MRSAGAHLSSFAQQYHVTSSVTKRFAAVIPSANGQFIVNVSPERLYISPYPNQTIAGNAKLPAAMPKILPNTVALPE